MFARLFAVASLAVLAVAGPVGLVGATSATGSIDCCNRVYQAYEINNLLDIFGVNALADVTGQVGMGCNPISVIGVGSGATCTRQTVCCTDTRMNGLVQAGCSPINLDA